MRKKVFSRVVVETVYDTAYKGNRRVVMRDDYLYSAFKGIVGLDRRRRNDKARRGSQ